MKNGRYVTFDDKEMEALRPASTRVIEVSDFVALEEIDPIYYKSTSWLVPNGEAAKKSYQLLVAAMDDAQQVGIGTVVLRDKQHLVAVRPLDDVLACRRCGSPTRLSGFRRSRDAPSRQD